MKRFTALLVTALFCISLSATAALAFGDGDCGDKGHKPIQETTAGTGEESAPPATVKPG